MTKTLSWVCLLITLALIFGCAGDVRFMEPRPSEERKTETTEPKPTPPPSQRPLQRRVERFCYGLPSGSPVVFFVLHPSLTLKGNRDSLQRSLATFAQELLGAKHCYSELKFYVGIERKENASNLILVDPSMGPRRLQTLLTDALDLLPELHSDPLVTASFPLENFARAMRYVAKALQTDGISSHFIYLRDQDYPEVIERERIDSAKREFVTALNIRPFNLFRYHISMLSYSRERSECLFADHQATAHLEPLFKELNWQWQDLCLWQPGAGVEPWSTGSRDLVDRIHLQQRRHLLACAPVGEVEVSMSGRPLLRGEDFQFHATKNELFFLSTSGKVIREGEVFEVKYDCQI